jgi:hypothetical protein
MSEPNEDDVIRSAVKLGPSNRSWLLSIALVIQAVIGSVMWLALLLEFWIIGMNLLGDPEPVWAQILWLFPIPILILFTWQTLIFGMEDKPWRAPSIWGFVTALISTVLTIVSSIFYQRLFWQCYLNKGGLGPIQTQICNDAEAALSTIAWFIVVFFIYNIISAIVMPLVYIHDVGRVGELLDKIKSYKSKVTDKIGDITNKIKSLTRESGELYDSKDADSKLIKSIIHSSLPFPVYSVESDNPSSSSSFQPKIRHRGGRQKNNNNNSLMNSSMNKLFGASKYHRYHNNSGIGGDSDDDDTPSIRV